MIEIYEGRLGGGKTYTAVEAIVSEIAKGWTVCTNIRCNWEAIDKLIRERFGVVPQREQLILLSQEQIGAFHRYVPWGDLRGSGGTARVKVKVDEAHLTFNSRDWAQTSRELLAFLTQSDKVSVDITFISQTINNIDKQFRALAQYVWRFLDTEKYIIKEIGCSYATLVRVCSLGLFSGKQVLRQQYLWPDDELLYSRPIERDPAIYACYETAALLTDFPEVPKAGTRVLEKVERKPNKMLQSILPIMLVGGIVAGVVYYKNRSHEDIKGAAAGGASAPLVAAPSSGSPKSGQDKRNEPTKAYDIYSEQFVAYYGADRTLKTREGWYTVGEMSGKGFVVAVSNRRAKLHQPDGRTGWVVATEYSSPEKVVANVSQVAEPVKVDKNQPIIANWSPLPTPGIDAHEAVIDAERKRPIGKR